MICIDGSSSNGDQFSSVDGFLLNIRVFFATHFSLRIGWGVLSTAVFFISLLLFNSLVRYQE